MRHRRLHEELRHPKLVDECVLDWKGRPARSFEAIPHLAVEADRPLVVRHHGELQSANTVRARPGFELGEQPPADPLPCVQLPDAYDYVGRVSIAPDAATHRLDVADEFASAIGDKHD
jgi:hypothetical protein